ncbi:DUF397 domain-containing protein [Streptomyces scopuliridis]|uniref:DUF397 domain-containing protein n=1 Tax=Streptomyces scopuliridis TaxID=452529 RepID=UPI0036C2EF9C
MSPFVPREPALAWRKSSYSGADSNCVEVAVARIDMTPVRDSKAPDGPRLTFGAGAWTSFVTALKADAGPWI